MCSFQSTFELSTTSLDYTNRRIVEQPKPTYSSSVVRSPLPSDLDPDLPPDLPSSNTHTHTPHHRPARSVFHWLSDLTMLSPLQLVSAACINSDFNRFDNYVYFTSLLFLGICALVWISYYIRVRILKRADEANGYNGTTGGQERTGTAGAAGAGARRAAAARQMARARRHARASDHNSQRLDELYSEHMGVFLLITFLAYPNLSKIQFEALDCSTEFDGQKYLRCVWRT